MDVACQSRNVSRGTFVAAGVVEGENPAKTGLYSL